MNHQTDLVATFEEQARKTPDAIALEDADVTLTYAQLEERTAKLAALLQARYLSGEAASSSNTPLIGILMGRCADYVVASLAILRAGAAFLVLELAYPDSLLNGVIQDARPAAILTHSTHGARIRKSGVPSILFDKDKPYESQISSFTSAKHDPERLAFVSYSSGTTGRPKGEILPHFALLFRRAY
jgi:non-ribosomal peptide synthetase component F